MAVGLLGFLAWMGHRIVFAQFQGYDDEGYLLITVQQFLQGLPLYNDIYTQYGPAYYSWQQFLRGIVGIPLTHDATRVVTVVVWLSSAILVGVPVWLLTRRPLMTALGVTVAFFHLTQLTFEPGHPQELCLLAIMSVVAITMWRLVTHGRLSTPTTLAIGALVALTALTKINVGAFLVGALTLGLVMSLRKSSWRTALVRIAAVLAVAAVAGLMRSELLRSDVANWVIVVWSGLLAALAAGSDDAAASDGVIEPKNLVHCAAAAAVVGAAILVAALAHGTSLGALVEGLFVWPLRFPTVFWRKLPIPFFAAVVAPVWLFVALNRRNTIFQRWMPYAALAFGQVLLLLSLVKAFGLLLAFGPPLAWLLLNNGSRTPGERAARRLLVFATIFMALQAYPMPQGTQIVLATVFFVPVALVMVADAEWAISGGRGPTPAPQTAARRVVLVLLALLVATTIGASVQRVYANAIPLGLPGAAAVRVSERDRATYWWLTMNLRENCGAFFTAPGLNSLHLWTGLPPVSSLNTTLWPLLFDAAQQDRILAAATRTARFCVVWEPKRMEALTSAPAPGGLVAWLSGEFEPQAALGGWELRFRRGTHPTLVYQGRWLEGGGIVLELPPLGDDPVTHLEAVDLDAARSLWSSADDGVAVVDEANAQEGTDAAIDVTRRRRLVIRGVSAPLSTQAAVVIRLRTSGGRLLASVPVVGEH